MAIERYVLLAKETIIEDISLPATQRKETESNLEESRTKS
jgi:hypothetical protein